MKYANPFFLSLHENINFFTDTERSNTYIHKERSLVPTVYVYKMDFTVLYYTVQVAEARPSGTALGGGGLKI